MIRSRRTFALRAAIPYVTLALTAVAGSLLMPSDDPDPRTALIVCAAFLVICGIARSILWLAVAGRSCVSRAGSAVEVSGGLRRRLRIPVEGIRRAEVRAGDRRPEWARFATLPAVILWVESGDGRRQVRRSLLVPWALLPAYERDLERLLADSRSAPDHVPRDPGVT